MLVLSWLAWSIYICTGLGALDCPERFRFEPVRRDGGLWPGLHQSSRLKRHAATSTPALYVNRGGRDGIHGAVCFRFDFRSAFSLCRLRDDGNYAGLHIRGCARLLAIQHVPANFGSSATQRQHAPGCVGRSWAYYVFVDVRSRPLDGPRFAAPASALSVSTPPFATARCRRGCVCRYAWRRAFRPLGTQYLLRLSSILGCLGRTDVGDYLAALLPVRVRRGWFSASLLVRERKTCGHPYFAHARPDEYKLSSESERAARRAL